MIASAPQTHAEPDVILRADGLVKTYAGVQALKGVSLSVRRGSIHGLLGENGAGKSTLVGLISGMRTPTSGEIWLDGSPVGGRDVKAMEQAGVFLVTQEPMIVDPLSVEENLLLGRWPSKGGFVDFKRLRRDATHMLEGVGIAPDMSAGLLGAVEKRKLNILRALFSGGRVIILDEPTTSLTVADRNQLFDFMRELRGRGVTFIFISHYNEEILEICDAVSVLRDGALAGESADIAALNSDSLSEMVLGRDLSLFHRRKRTPETLSPSPGVYFRDVRAAGVAVADFSIAAGEIVGFAGLPGSGAKDFARCMFGLEPTESGSFAIAGQEPIPLPAAPHEAFRHGIAYLSDDRRRDGLVGIRSIGDNLVMSSLDALSSLGWIDTRREGETAQRYFRQMGVKAPGLATPGDSLSGGNQQKVCLGRVIATGPKLLILDEPTRGIDVGVKEDVHRQIDTLTGQGMSVIVITTDLDEMVRTVDRVCVFSGGAIVETLIGSDITKERLRAAAFDRAANTPGTSQP
ncbi:sugar ABC transporter ATP-binding protein [Labrys monachus]|uniref:ABC-type sugar transport system ATPase subunit n=1 Tax=Labrys monachus TaxID=217067 RepID=A0ABU0FBY0_9HYPH|nr:sugar ABC transporter ATP-binding protein [Labrys monachus]MDQ0392120.1 ABC-type sugar transport system ATPase subunit [Labrys monachus]